MRGRLLDKQGGRVIESGNRLPHHFVMGIFGLVKTCLALALAPSCYRLLLSLTASIEERKEVSRGQGWSRKSGCEFPLGNGFDMRRNKEMPISALCKFKNIRNLDCDFYSRAFHSCFHLALA